MSLEKERRQKGLLYHWRAKDCWKMWMMKRRRHWQKDLLLLMLVQPVQTIPTKVRAEIEMRAERDCTRRSWERESLELRLLLLLLIDDSGGGDW